MSAFFKLTEDQERDLNLARGAFNAVITLADAYGRQNIDLNSDDLVSLLTIISERLPVPEFVAQGGAE